MKELKGTKTEAEGNLPANTLIYDGLAQAVEALLTQDAEK